MAKNLAAPSLRRRAFVLFTLRDRAQAGDYRNRIIPVDGWTPNVDGGTVVPFDAETVRRMKARLAAKRIINDDGKWIGGHEYQGG